MSTAPESIQNERDGDELNPALLSKPSAQEKQKPAKPRKKQPARDKKKKAPDDCQLKLFDDEP